MVPSEGFNDLHLLVLCYNLLPVTVDNLLPTVFQVVWEADPSPLSLVMITTPLDCVMILSGLSPGDPVMVCPDS